MLIFKFCKLKLARNLPDLKYKSKSLCNVCQNGNMVVKTPFSSKNIVAYSRLIEHENFAMYYRNKKSHKSDFFFSKRIVIIATQQKKSYLYLEK